MAEDTTTIDPGQEAAVDDAPDGEEQPETPAAEPRALEAGDPVREARWTRLILPVALPIGAAVMLAVFVLNVSRIFLATGSTGAVVLGVTLIVVILGGGAAMSAAPRLRTSSLVMLVSGGFILVMAAGLVAAPASVEKSGGGGGNGLVNPAGPATSTLTVSALPSLKFDANQYTVKAGVVQMNYVSKGGSHTLDIDDPKYATFNLAAPGGPTTGKVLLKPGTYTIFCNIPGHRAAGMQATVIAQ